MRVKVFDGNRMMIVLPKLLGLYKCPILEPRRLDAAAAVEKVTVTNF
jgi:hypothetical protein